MHVQIKNRFTGNIIHEGQFASIRECLFDAIKKGADLKGADLKNADLEDAYLEGADLKGAYLEGADLKGAYLKGADLKGADLKGADLKNADLKNAYLKGADLKGADLKGAYLKGADLKGADLKVFVNGKVKHDLSIPKIENIHSNVYDFAKQDRILDMSEWHSSCGTSHCWGGTIVHLAGEDGYKLENRVGTQLAALLINVNSSNILIKKEWFHYIGNSEALEKMKELSSKEQAFTT